MPITTEVAVTASDLRSKYYQRGGCELSYADAIHIATAAMTDCNTLYSGDPDFENIDEVDTEVL
jgi:predicted nucleic acid-binding protein